MFTIPCTIGETKFKHAMLDLGASINLISYSLFKTLGLGNLQETRVVIQLANHSQIYLRGFVENVLIMVDKLIFPTDLFVLDMEHGVVEAPILLGMPFLRTAKTKIDCWEGKLPMEFDGEKVQYFIMDAMKYPVDEHSLFSIDVIEPIVDDVFELNKEDELQVALEAPLDELSLEYPLK